MKRVQEPELRSLFLAFQQRMDDKAAAARMPKQIPAE
jgi:hypothetical protein